MNGISKFLGSSVCVVAITVGTLALSTTSRAQCLLTDPHFDLGITAPNPNPTGIAGRSEFGGAAIVPSGVALSAPNVLVLPAGGGGYSVPGAYQEFAVTPSQTYTFNGYVYLPA